MNYEPISAHRPFYSGHFFLGKKSVTFEPPAGPHSTFTKSSLSAHSKNIEYFSHDYRSYFLSQTFLFLLVFGIFGYVFLYQQKVI